MNITDTKIKVDDQAINPTLNCGINLEFDSSIEIPISISGRLLHQNGRVISLISEHQINSENTYGLRLWTKSEKENSIRENNKNHHYVQLSAELTQLALESIELQRDKNSDNSIKFSLDLIVKSLRLNKEIQENNFSDFIELKIDRKYENVNIEQSDWINNFSEKLGIGKFMLVELNIPNRNLPEFWLNLFSKLKANVEDMEKCIRGGDWQKTMLFARKFFENIKIGDKKKGHKNFKEEFNKKMKENQHSEQGTKNLYDAIWKFFEFLSKFIHDKDTDGNSYEVLPIPTKEDAYFAYALSIGLLGLIGKKLEL
jgi:hypothetical protein